MSEDFNNIIREYIDFVNRQVGVYMDALAGFEGHHVSITRQVHRENRPTNAGFNEKGEKIVVWTAFEDPSKPDIVISNVRRAKDHIAANAKDGSNTQQHSQSVLVFIYSYWEHDIRPRLERAKNDEVLSDLMGDLRFVRHSILHHKGIMRLEKNQEFKILGDMFPVNQPIQIPYENMHRVFVLIKQDCARMLGVPNPETIKDLAIQRLC